MNRRDVFKAVLGGLVLAAVPTVAEAGAFEQNFRPYNGTLLVELRTGFDFSPRTCSLGFENGLCCISSEMLHDLRAVYTVDLIGLTQICSNQNSNIRFIPLANCNCIIAFERV